MFGAASPATQSDPVEEALLGLLPPKDESPETLHRAMHHAVFSGGKRIRPRLLLTVASACAADDAEMDLAMRAGCAIEFIHS
ncbi:MAG TPA: polyprenyl synthetase family protein, partial [Pseudomonadota bacterium]|nr:polyprenyl synthetase family protein [Pseudomonadota bacterium]